MMSLRLIESTVFAVYMPEFILIDKMDILFTTITKSIIADKRKCNRPYSGRLPERILHQS